MASRVEDIVVSRFDLNAAETERKSPADDLVNYVMGYVNEWRQYRDNTHKVNWDNWFATWMGKFRNEMKTRKTERSRIISPGSQMAVDLTNAEIVEGVFSRKMFFGLSDDTSPEERQAAEQTRKRLAEDLIKAGMVDSFNEASLNGALYGTGILKLAMDVEKVKTVNRVPIEDEQGQPTAATRLVASEEEQVVIRPVAIEPGQFVPDPSANKIDDMLGCAHEYRLPLHKIQQRQADGTYLNRGPIGPAPSGTEQDSATAERKVEQGASAQTHYADITEWHGLVPARLLAATRAQNSGQVNIAVGIANSGDDELAEAIVTIANGGELLRAIPAPTIMKDRAIVAWQHDTVPNAFWGRGVMAKADNVQKATDAEMRARIDNLAWVSNPMLAVKATAMAPGTNMNIWPGKIWALREGVQDSIRELKFGEINGSSFNQTQELGSWMSQATGTVDTIGARQNVRDEATGAAAIQQSGFLKRARRTMFNIEGAMTTFIRRALWRKIEFDGDRYPQDFEFQVTGTTGMMARELERQQLIGALQFTEQGSPEQLVILKKIFEWGNADGRAELMDVIDKRLQGPSEEEQAAAEQTRQLKIEEQQLTNQKLRGEGQETRAKTLKLAADAGLAEAKTGLTRIQAQVEQDSAILDVARLQIDQQEVTVQEQQIRQKDRALDQQERKLDLQERQTSSE